MSKRDPAYMVSPASPHASPFFSREFLETVLESSYDGIYITDGEAITIMVNRSYEAISGLHRQELLGQSMRDLVKKQTISQSGTIAALERREPVTLEQVFKTGKRAIITSTPIFNEDNQVVMVVTNVRDVTELYTLKEELLKSQDENLQYRNELENLRSRLAGSGGIVAVSPVSKELMRLANRVAGLDVNILLKGETGVGKRELARYMVSKNRRRKGPFMQIDCSSYSADTLEGRLFGYAPGQLPSCPAGQKGILELTDGGTVLLEEISELPVGVQMRLFQMLQGHGVMRVGALDPVYTNVRVLATTSQDLKALVEQRAFHRELFYKLNTLPITVPPLRERREDIMILVENLTAQLNKKYHQKKKFSQEALLALQNYDWPGNLQELQNVIERTMIMCSGEWIGPEDLPISHDAHPSQEQAEAAQEQVDLRKMVNEMELLYIRKAYQRFGNVRDAARSLNLDPSTFVRKRKKLEENERVQLLQK